MTLPGPTGVAWVLGLLVWALAAVVVGEFVRALASRRIGSWRSPDSIERLLLDFYLGGAAMYLIAALPFGAFIAPVVFGLPVIAGAGLVGLVLLERRSPPTANPAGPVASLLRPAAVVGLLTALGLLIFELAIALPVATGNTFDSSLLTLYVSLLLQHHSIPLSFQPYASLGLLYPQGTTVWLGWAQLDFGLPPARTSLLVTPLFFALAPLGGFVFGRRAFGSDRAAVAFAISLAAIGSWSRVLVAGSNDFVFAFPLVLLLAGQSFGWLRGTVPSIPDSLGFGVLLGYSAAMNPVGAEWLLPALLVTGLFVRPRYSAAPLRWFGRWGVALLASLLALLPTLYVLTAGRNSPGFTPGAASPPAGAGVGFTSAQFVGSIDPYLFRPTDVWLSPIPALRLELAILITVGIGILFLARPGSAVSRYLQPFRSFLAASVTVILAFLGLVWAASLGFGPAIPFTELTSAGELSIWLFTLYTFLAGLVLVLLLERAVASAQIPSGSASVSRAAARPRPSRGLPRGTASLLLVLIIVVPGVALTTTSLPPVLTELYQDFGNVTAGDFGLLSYAGAHLPAGARVLIAPGSAAGFLPGYVADLVLLYPLVPGWQWQNQSYRVLVSQLTNGTLSPTGVAALSDLDVQYVVVTGANTLLWLAFSPAPFLADPTFFPALFHDGDAYLFQIVGA